MDNIHNQQILKSHRFEPKLLKSFDCKPIESRKKDYTFVTCFLVHRINSRMKRKGVNIPQRNSSRQTDPVGFRGWTFFHRGISLSDVWRIVLPPALVRLTCSCWWQPCRISLVMESEEESQTKTVTNMTSTKLRLRRLGRDHEREVWWEPLTVLSSTDLYNRKEVRMFNYVNGEWAYVCVCTLFVFCLLSEIFLPTANIIRSPVWQYCTRWRPVNTERGRNIWSTQKQKQKLIVCA